MTESITFFTDLVVWKEGHKLVLLTYRLTHTFPKEELFGLVSQMRRAAVSITSNIAEGFTRFSIKEKMQFYMIARASLVELQNQYIIARDVGYFEENIFVQGIQQITTVHKLLNGLLRKSRSL